MTRADESGDGTPPLASGHAGPALPALGQTIGGHVLESKLGQGAMGAVFVGVDAAGERHAVKVPFLGKGHDHATRARFEREAQVLAALPPHRGVVRVHGAGVEGDHGFLVLELVKGVTVEDVARAGPVPIPRALAIAEEVARALAHLHAHGVVHRDVKPSNILVREEDGSAVLADFGLVRMEGAESLTATGTFVGTPLYVAPEQALATKELDGRADVYSLGATLYLLLTGKPPHEAESLTELMRLMFTKRVAPPSKLRREVPRDVDAIVARTLEKEAGARYPTAADLAEDLAAVRAGRRIRRRSFAPVLLLLLVAAGVAVAVLARSASLRPGDEPVTAAAPPTAREALDDALSTLGLRARPGVAALDLVQRAEENVAALGSSADDEGWRRGVDERLRVLRPLAAALDHARAGRVEEASAALAPLGPLTGSLLERVSALEARTALGSKGGAILLARLRVEALTWLAPADFVWARAEAVSYLQRALGSKRETGIELLAELLERAPASANASELLLALDERSRQALASPELETPPLARGFAAISSAALARGDSARAARFFERVLRQDAAAAPGEELESAILHRTTDLASGRRLPELVDALLDKLRIGRVAAAPAWAHELEQQLEERIVREPDDWALRILYADLLLKSAVKDRHERGLAVVNPVAQDARAPLIARARACKLLAEHHYYRHEWARTVAAVVSAHAFGHDEPDDCSRLAGDALRRAYLTSDPFGSIAQAVSWCRRAVGEADDRIARMKAQTLAEGRPGRPPLAPVEDREVRYDTRSFLLLVLLSVEGDAAVAEAERVADEERALVESGAVDMPWRLLLARLEYARGREAIADRLVDEVFGRDSHDRDWLFRELETMVRDLDAANRPVAAARAARKLAALRDTPK